MNTVCRKCKHLISSPETPETHVCPTPEYIEARNRLVSDVCDAEDSMTIEEKDELERRMR